MLVEDVLTEAHSSSDDDEHRTTSSSSVEHRRTYHNVGNAKYPLPNDSQEVRRLELQHRIWQLSLSDRLHSAPFKAPPTRTLDLGCGTGAWVLELASQYPQCQITGVDLSAIQPSTAPPNVDFRLSDFTAEWSYPQKFDYIHSRAITAGVKDWPKLVNDVWDNLEPGGFVEFQEYHLPFLCDDSTLEDGPATFKQWNETFPVAAAEAGLRLDAIFDVPPLLKKRGFEAPGHAATKWPLGTWAKGEREKRIGEMFAEDMISALEGISMRLFTGVLGWTEDAVRTHIARVEKDIRAGSIHAYIEIEIVWAQKPFEAMSA